MDKLGYSYLLVLKTLWEKEKLLVTSNFSFSHDVFKSRLLLTHLNEYLPSKRLTEIKEKSICALKSILYSKVQNWPVSYE